jgi:hypothetical protein
MATAMANLYRSGSRDKRVDDPTPVSHGDSSAAWEFIDEIAALAAVQAELIRHCAAQGDKPGAAFAARRLRACVRAIGETIKEELP